MRVQRSSNQSATESKAPKRRFWSVTTGDLIQGMTRTSARIANDCPDLAALSFAFTADGILRIISLRDPAGDLAANADAAAAAAATAASR